jgi:L-aspartate oxidase
MKGLMVDHFETEVLIIGCGIAGGIAALELADAGISVTVVTRSVQPEESNTLYAQGGIIYKGEQDSPALLVKDLIRAGAGHSNPKAVQILAHKGPELVEKILLKKLDLHFDITSQGAYSLVTEGSHSTARILHSKDNTGELIQKAIIKALKKNPYIKLLTGYTAVDLLTPSHHSIDRLKVYDTDSCCGAYLFDQEHELVIPVVAKKTILATGGLGQIYLRSSNPTWARGDGLAMAYRAGARVINCEFIQFHPTTFHYKLAPHFLISESVRGAGAKLVDNKGTPFMKKYDPEWEDLAPRDVVARAIHEEMLIKDISNVYLDFVSYIPQSEIKTKFPTIYQSCLEYGIDITKEPVPVVPGAHYFCGGVWVDEWGQTTIQNLYAVGEVSCTGVHGANRLASASLLEGLVWGSLSAQHIHQNLAEVPNPEPQSFPPWQDLGIEKPDPALISQDMSSIKNIMWNYVGLVRSSDRLARALRELHNLEFEIVRFYRVSKLSDSLIGLRNAVRSGLIVAESAWTNKKSMGCHYRLS